MNSFKDAYRRISRGDNEEQLILERFQILMNNMVSLNEAFSKLPSGIEVSSLSKFAEEDSENMKEESMDMNKAYGSVIMPMPKKEKEEEALEEMTAEKFFESFYSESEVIKPKKMRKWEEAVDPQHTKMVGEAEKFIGATVTNPSEKEIIEYMDRVLNGEKSPKDKFMMPYVHKSLLVQIGGGTSIVMDKNQENAVEVDSSDKSAVTKIDLELLKKELTARPKEILSQNAKMLKSGGEDFSFLNFGIPALRGLAVDESTNKFVVVNTCPGAGSCKLVCYALKGFYVQYPNVFKKQTKMLNYLLNDPDGFFRQLNVEISKITKKEAKKGVKLIVRWHDAGDFFSDEYKRLFFEVVEKNPDVLFYAYTKLADIATGERPENFILNFSQGALASQENKVDIKKIKNSVIVTDKTLFSDLVVKMTTTDEETGEEVKSLQYKSPEAIQELKERLADRYDITVSSILTYKEMLDTPKGDTHQYNVIVVPGEGDVSASRKDVLGTYLLVH